MANRQIFGLFNAEQVLRISRPGYNVLSTGLTADQLVFDSRWTYVGKVWMKGAVVVNNSPVTVYYGRSFVKPPIVVIFAVQPPPYGGTFLENWGYEYHDYQASYLTINPLGVKNTTAYYFILET